MTVRARPPGPELPGLPRLGVGVVSRNTVAAAIELAYEERCRLMLIASRRQVDGRGAGGGYVEGWSADAFADYVRARDPERRVLLARDHGGPWQHPSEAEADEQAATRSALESFRRDVRAGFALLHVDVTATRDGDRADGVAIDRLVRTYARVARDAARRGRDVGFEVSLGPEAAEVEPAGRFRDRLGALVADLAIRGLPAPVFVTAGTGTRVRGTENVGALADPRRRIHAARRLRELALACAAAGTRLKAHNCDYLDMEGWTTLLRCGVRAANVAPQYGLAETLALVELLRRAGLAHAARDFAVAAYDSGAWRKWVPEHPPLTPARLGLLAGHYLFSTPEGEAVRALAAQRLPGGLADLDAHLRARIKDVIRSHVHAIAPARRSVMS